MKHLILVATITLIAFTGSIATQPRADDAHHPEKAAKAKKAATAKTKQQKRPATKTDKSKQSGMRISLELLKV